MCSSFSLCVFYNALLNRTIVQLEQLGGTCAGITQQLCESGIPYSLCKDYFYQLYFSLQLTLTQIDMQSLLKARCCVARLSPTVRKVLQCCQNLEEIFQKFEDENFHPGKLLLGLASEENQQQFKFKTFMMCDCGCIGQMWCPHEPSSPILQNESFIYDFSEDKDLGDILFCEERLNDNQVLQQIYDQCFQRLSSWWWFSSPAFRLCTTTDQMNNSLNFKVVGQEWFQEMVKFFHEQILREEDKRRREDVWFNPQFEEGCSAWGESELAQQNNSFDVRMQSTSNEQLASNLESNILEEAGTMPTWDMIGQIDLGYPHPHSEYGYLS